MIEEKIEITTPDGISTGFICRPEGDQRWPGVIHLTDIGGIRPAQHEMAQRLAAKGYFVFVPNVFYRTGRPPLFEPGSAPGGEQFMKRFAELASPLTPEAVERDAACYVDFLAAQEAVSPGALGVVGYCFTGGLAIRAAAAKPDKIAAAASFHGSGLFTEAPTSPHRLLARIQAQLYFGHAVQDRSMPEEAIQKLDQALAEWGGRYESDVYEGAYHSWTVPDSPVYNRPQAERAFAKLVELFARTLN